MKCIGVEQWSGVDPDMAAILNDLENQAARVRQSENDRWNHMSPSEKFLRLASDRFHVPRLFGVAP